MNDPSERLPDESLDELLAQFRAVDLPKEMRTANREAVRRALARRDRTLWWRRSVAVPVPLVIAASLVLVVTAAASLWPILDGSATRPDTAVLGRNGVVEAGAESPGWSVTRSFILSIDSLSRMDDSFCPDLLEDRNDT